MKKRTGFLTLAAATLFAATPVVANAKAKPSVNSKYWSTQRLVKLSKTTKASEYKVVSKNNKLNIQNKVIKHAKIKKGTELYARNMGNGSWQIINGKYTSSNKGVWLIKDNSTKWFNLSKNASKYWNNQHYARVKKSVTAIQKGVVIKNKKLNITNKNVKKSRIPAGTKLYARNMGNGLWQINSQKYPSNQQGVWTVNEYGSAWLTAAKAPKPVSKYWNTQRYVVTTKDVPAVKKSVTTKDNKLNITNKTLDKKTIPSGTKMNARYMGNNSWQIISNQYQSNKDGVWLVNESNSKWLKTTAAPKPTQAIKSEYSKVSSDTISSDPNNPTIAYTPLGFKPINMDGFTINPGQQVQVYSDNSQNAWVFINNGKKYALKKSNNYNVTTANSVVGSNNNIQSNLSPDDPAAFVTSNYQPKNGNLWIQLNSDGTVKQYYFYNNQDKNNTGWFKGKIQSQNGQNTIVPEN